MYLYVTPAAKVDHFIFISGIPPPHGSHFSQLGHESLVIKDCCVLIICSSVRFLISSLDSGVS